MNMVFRPRRKATQPVETTNPFTGAIIRVPGFEPLKPHERAAVEGALEKTGVLGPVEKDGSRKIDFPEGGGHCFLDDAHFPGCWLAFTPPLTSRTLRVLFDIMNAADWVLAAVIDKSGTVIMSLPGPVPAFPEAPQIVCNSPEELGAILSRADDD